MRWDIRILFLIYLWKNIFLDFDRDNRRINIDICTILFHKYITYKRKKLNRKNYVLEDMYTLHCFLKLMTMWLHRNICFWYHLDYSKRRMNQLSLESFALLNRGTVLGPDRRRTTGKNSLDVCESSSCLLASTAGVTKGLGLDDWFIKKSF